MARYYESELVTAMMDAVVDGTALASAKEDIKVFQEAVDLLPKYNGTPELVVYLMRKLIHAARQHHNMNDIMREAHADWDKEILATIKP